MEEKIRGIAARIRGLREDQGLTLESLAGEMGISPAALRSFESGKTDIPIGFLYKLSARLHAEMGSLLTGDEPHMHVYSVVRKGRGVTVERRKEYRYQSLGANFAGKKAEPFLVTVDPKPGKEPVALNAHPGQEFDFVLEGTLQVMVDGHEVVLEEGDSLFFDSGHPHGMQALNGRTARFLAVVI